MSKAIGVAVILNLNSSVRVRDLVVLLRSVPNILNPDFPLGDFSHFGDACSDSGVIAIAGIDVTCSNGNH